MKDELFWSKVKRGDEDACWEWQGYRNEAGYGLVKRSGVRYLTHRYAITDATEAEPGDKMVLHHCDNPPCCNPKHLYIGTAADNMRDKMRRGRPTGHKGILSDEDRMAIAISDARDCDLARWFSVSETTIRYWKSKRKRKPLTAAYRGIVPFSTEH